jgi:hypothetical protein
MSKAQKSKMLTLSHIQGPFATMCEMRVGLRDRRAKALRRARAAGRALLPMHQQKLRICVGPFDK